MKITSMTLTTMSLLLVLCSLRHASLALAQVESSTLATTDLSITQVMAAEKAKLEPEQIAPLLDKPLYEFTEAEVDLYLKYLQAAEPDLRSRIVHLARKNVGQPYELYLLGEMPFEHYDPQPIYCLDKSDCVVFSEHTYAMALGHDWPSFMSLLQRIRYRDGRIGVATRNHYTEADWNPSNRWLVRDITNDVGKGQVAHFRQRVDRSAFLKKRYSLDVDIPVEKHTDSYLPLEKIEMAKPHLQDGDFVNVVRGIVGANTRSTDGVQESAWVGHVGLIGIGKDESGARRVSFIHSASPKVREEPIDSYIARSLEDAAERDAAGKARLLGFKFLRLEADPLENLSKIDGPDAPRVTLPKGGQASFE